MITNYYITNNIYEKSVRINFVDNYYNIIDMFVHMIPLEELKEIYLNLSKHSNYEFNYEYVSLTVLYEKVYFEIKLPGEEVMEANIELDILIPIFNEYISEVNKMNEELDGMLIK